MVLLRVVRSTWWSARKYIFALNVSEPFTILFSSRNVFVILTPDNTICPIFGRRGEGKTLLSYGLALEHDRVLVFDGRWQFPSYPKHHWQIVYEIKDLVPLLRPPPEKFRVVLRSRHPREEFPWVCKMLNEMEDCFFVVDEMLKVSDRYIMPPWWDDLIHFSRHPKIGVILTTQRPTDVHGDIRAEATDIICLRQHHPRDLQAMGEVIAPEAAALIATLPDYHALHWTPKKSEVLHYNVDTEKVEGKEIKFPLTKG